MLRERITNVDGNEELVEPAFVVRGILVKSNTPPITKKTQ